MADLFDAEVMQHLQALLPDKMHPTLVEMAEQMYLHLVEDADAVAALGHARLARIVLGQIERVSMQCGGGGFYLPKGVWYRNGARDQEIYARFNGRNMHQLAREYNLTDMRIAQILDEQRTADIQRRQGKIDFGE
ncbi:Mor transcription activator family protein [Azonexus sp. R2A61]|uniref:Mor transcription activator family protein n=1 Tax=Azonexus sp. R2A61 TaxID=2744443 RepID=UPI001F18D7DF|nr:Mor transcription activator family protein [Azonexus sp. R2A61]